jgi:hypothetical protein
VPRRALALAALLLAFAGCGGGGGESGSPTASLWVTRDGGTKVMLTTSVPAGTSVLQALDREADIETRYGGRFVQSIEGVEGDLGKRRDWFFFVNGIEPGRGAAEVKLRPGDIAWWDHRSWAARMAEPVVVGAFPEPFVHGWEGRRRPVELRLPAGFEGNAPPLRRLLGGPGGSGESNVFEVVIDDVAEGATLVARRGARDGSPVSFTLSGTERATRRALKALLGDPTIVRYRYTARFDEGGEVVR